MLTLILILLLKWRLGLNFINVAKLWCNYGILLCCFNKPFFISYRVPASKENCVNDGWNGSVDVQKLETENVDCTVQHCSHLLSFCFWVSRNEVMLVWIQLCLCKGLTKHISLKLLIEPWNELKMYFVLFI
jgi:hypothetical protein